MTDDRHRLLPSSPWRRCVVALAAAWLSMLPMLFPLPTLAEDSPSAEEGVVPFVVYRPGEDEPVYLGEIRTTRHGALITDHQVYRTPAGEPVMEVVSVFDQEAGQSLAYSSLDFRSGRTEKVWRINNEMHFQVRLTRDSSLVEGLLEWEPAVFLWTSMVHVVHRQWALLSRGETFSFRLFIPSLKTEFGMRLKKSEDSQKDQTRLEMVPTSPFLRLLMDPMTLVYASDHPGRLLEYQGRGAVRNRAGKTEDLRIVMQRS